MPAGSPMVGGFMLSQATVMIGAQSEFAALQPASHSLGLVKDVKFMQDRSETKLGFGIRNTIVDSQVTNEELKVTFNCFEINKRTLELANGVAGTAPTAGFSKAPTANVAAGATTVSVAGDVSSNVQVGNLITLTESEDKVHVAKVTAVSYSAPNTTITFTGDPVPTGVTFAAASTVVAKSSLVNVGTGGAVPYLSAKISGQFSDGGSIIILLPKIRIIKGLEFAYQSSDYPSMPFELSVYLPTASDPGYKYDGTNNAQAIVLTSK